MKRKSHAKVYVISDESLRCCMDPARELEYTLAHDDGIRAKCFSSAELDGVAVDDKGFDWQMNIALTETMMETCDVVAVLGGKLTPNMQREILLASKIGKLICVAEPIRNIVKSLMRVKVSTELLANVYKRILNKNGEKLKCR